MLGLGVMYIHNILDYSWRCLNTLKVFLLGFQAYSTEYSRHGKKLKRAIVDLGMTDLADDLTVEFDFKGYEHNSNQN